MLTFPVSLIALKFVTNCFICYILYLVVGLTVDSIILVYICSLFYYIANILPLSYYYLSISSAQSLYNCS